MNLPLTPIRFLLWAADEYGSKVNVVSLFDETVIE